MNQLILIFFNFLITFLINIKLNSQENLLIKTFKVLSDLALLGLILVFMEIKI